MTLGCVFKISEVKNKFRDEKVKKSEILMF